jgi:hypothetical protein
MNNDRNMLERVSTKKRIVGYPVVGALVLFFVFFLPLHFHPANENRQISHECSCYLGGQTQLGSCPSSTALIFAPEFFFIVVSRPEGLVGLEIESDSARAPPLSIL